MSTASFVLMLLSQASIMASLARTLHPTLRILPKQGLHGEHLSISSTSISQMTDNLPHFLTGEVLLPLRGWAV
jgi:hypothetical protein